ncbi:MAG TPA: c-type cytochrome [Candidatus Lustribacter sp.]|nr:c-type cytochrome [Candidatus Lustribacter sp.]
MAARRRHPAAIALLLLLGLLVTGGAYSLLAPKPAKAAVMSADEIAKGKNLFLANCATCHGLSAQGTQTGPSLYGVGAAAVDFQVSTGRMPMVVPGVQAARSEVKFSEEEIAAMAAYAASLAPGPAVPDPATVTGEDANAAAGGELFRVNCAMCHNFAGAGGALTRGKYAPALAGATGTQVYEAMVTGPSSMPVFSDTNMDLKAKNDVIAYLTAIENEQQVGGFNLGNLGPVSEGFFVWIFGLGLLIACAVWLGRKAA